MILRMTQLEFESVILVNFTTAVPGFCPSDSWLCATLVTQIFTKADVMSWWRVISLHRNISKVDDAAVPSSAEMVWGKETGDTRISPVSCSCQKGLETFLAYAWDWVLPEGARQTCVQVSNGISQTILVMAILEEKLTPLLCHLLQERKKRILLGSDTEQSLSCMLCVSNRLTDSHTCSGHGLGRSLCWIS